MKKIMTIAEVELIRLNANDICCSSPGLNGITPVEGEIFDDGYGGGYAPTRYNYRGMATDWGGDDEWY